MSVWRHWGTSGSGVYSCKSEVTVKKEECRCCLFHRRSFQTKRWVGVEFKFRHGRKAQLSQNANVTACLRLCLCRKNMSAFEKSCLLCLIFKLLYFLIATTPASHLDCGDFQSQFGRSHRKTLSHFFTGFVLQSVSFHLWQNHKKVSLKGYLLIFLVWMCSILSVDVLPSVIWLGLLVAWPPSLLTGSIYNLCCRCLIILFSLREIMTNLK